MRCLFYAEANDQNTILQIVVGECIRDPSQIVLIWDIVLKLYFEGSSDLFEGDVTVLKKREILDKPLTLLLNTICTKCSLKQYAGILDDLWKTRLNHHIEKVSQGAYSHQLSCFAKKDLLLPLYTYMCLQKLLEIV